MSVGTTIKTFIDRNGVKHAVDSSGIEPAAISTTESDGSSAKVEAGVDDESNEGYVEITLRDNQSTVKTTTIHMDNITNLERALTTPSSTPENSTSKLITSKAVYDALAKKVPYYDGVVVIKHLDDTVAYPFAGDNEVLSSADAAYVAIPDNTYVLCRVKLDNSDLTGGGVIVVPAFVYVTSSEIQNEYTIEILFSNGIKFSANNHQGTDSSWTKTTYGFFS